MSHHLRCQDLLEVTRGPVEICTRDGGGRGGQTDLHHIRMPAGEVEGHCRLWHLSWARAASMSRHMRSRHPSVTSPEVVWPGQEPSHLRTFSGSSRDSWGLAESVERVEAWLGMLVSSGRGCWSTGTVHSADAGGRQRR